MKSELDTQPEATPIEIAIVAKWTLKEAWICCIEALDNRFARHELGSDEKSKLKEMYTSFFSQAFYSAVKTRGDVDELVRNSRKMLAMLKDLDRDAWTRLCLNAPAAGEKLSG